MTTGLYTQSSKFRILDRIDKLEIAFKALRLFDSGATAYDIARKIGCSPETARGYLNYLMGKKLIKKWKVGHYKLYAPKKLRKGFQVRLFLEKDIFK